MSPLKRKFDTSVSPSRVTFDEEDEYFTEGESENEGVLSPVLKSNLKYPAREEEEKTPPPPPSKPSPSQLLQDFNDMTLIDKNKRLIL